MQSVLAESVQVVLHRPSQLVTIVRDQGLGNRVQIACQNLVQFVERQVDAVIRQAVLREIVGADSLAAIA